MKSKVVFSSSLDPMTKAHEDIIKEALNLFDEVHVVMGENILKKSLLTTEEKIKSVNEVFKTKKVIVTVTQGLIVDYCNENNISYIIRGLRNTNDFTYEQDLNYNNSKINPNIRTIFLMAKQENIHISSTRVRELLYFKKDISKMVSSEVKKIIEEKFKEKNV